MKKTKCFTRKVYLYILFYTSIIAFFIPKVNIFLTFYSQNITFLYTLHEYTIDTHIETSITTIYCGLAVFSYHIQITKIIR